MIFYSVGFLKISSRFGTAPISRHSSAAPRVGLNFSSTPTSDVSSSFIYVSTVAAESEIKTKCQTVTKNMKNRLFDKF